MKETAVTSRELDDRTLMPGKSNFSRLCTLGCFLSCAAGPAYSQAVTISGTVLDPSQALVSKATVTVEETTTHRTIRTLTNAQGAFTLRAGTGTYNVTAVAPGFEPVHQLVEITTNSGPIILTLARVSSTTASVLVSAQVLSIGQPRNAEGINDVVVTVDGTGGKAELPISSVAQDIIVVPSKVLLDQDDRSVRQALENVSGVTNSGGTRDISDGMELVRGFPVGNFYRNGFLDESAGIGFNIPWDGDAERIELLKGASALLYGPAAGGFASIGGLVNTTTKKPLQEPSYTISSQGDTNGGWSILGDVSHQLNRNNTWLVRAVGELIDKESYIDRLNATQRNGYGILQGLINPKTTLTLSGEWVHQENGQYFGLPAYGTILPAPAASPYQSFSPRFNPEDPNSHETYDGGRFQAIVQRQLAPKWRLRLAFGADLGYRAPRQFFIGPSGDYATSGLFFVTTINPTVRTHTYFGDATIQGQFKTFGLQHQLVIGFQDIDAETDFSRTNGFSSFQRNVDVTKLWITQGGVLTPTEDDHPSTKTVTGYVNDLIQVAPHLTISAGISGVSARNTDTADVVAQTPTYSDTQTGPAYRIGPIVQITQSLFAFADYSNAFLPVPPQLQDNGVLYTHFNPITGNQYEAGLKYQVSRYASITGAIYQLTENNVLTDDPNNPDLVIQSGQQRSRGVELDASLHLKPGWDIIIAPAYTNAVVTHDNAFIIGSRLTSVPRWSGRFYSTYELQSRFLRGVGFGGNVDFATSRAADVPTTDAPLVGTLPGYGKFDMQAFYKFASGWRASINVVNLFNIRYYDSAQNLSRIIPGQPTTANFRLAKTF